VETPFLVSIFGCVLAVLQTLIIIYLKGLNEKVKEFSVTLHGRIDKLSKAHDRHIEDHAKGAFRVAPGTVIPSH